MTLNLKEEYFGERHLGNVQLDEIKPIRTNTQNEKKWTYVRARSMSRDAPLYSEGIYRVLSYETGEPLTQETAEIISKEEVLDRMPRSPKQRMAVPSIRGEYLTIKEIGYTENEDGTVTPKTKGQTSVIPSEFVIEILSYDTVVSELVDESL